VIGWRRTPLAAARWVVVDCETSGLDPARDRLLSVAAVEVAGGRIPAGRSYAAVLRQEIPSSTDNILVHGLGGEAQLGGSPVPQVLGELAAFMEGAMPVAFHAPFDQEILKRAFAQAGIRLVKKRWLDLAQVAPLLFLRRAATDLDGWLAEFSIDCPARHDALGDAYAAAQLLLVVLAEASRQRIASAEALLRTASSARWLPA
jgi:DNA polymerase III subunit epsilon